MTVSHREVGGAVTLAEMCENKFFLKIEKIMYNTPYKTGCGKPRDASEGALRKTCVRRAVKVLYTKNSCLSIEERAKLLSLAHCRKRSSDKRKIRDKRKRLFDRGILPHRNKKHVLSHKKPADVSEVGGYRVI